MAQTHDHLLQLRREGRQLLQLSLTVLQGLPGQAVRLLQSLCIRFLVEQGMSNGTRASACCSKRVIIDCTAVSYSSS